MNENYGAISIAEVAEIKKGWAERDARRLPELWTEEENKLCDPSVRTSREIIGRREEQLSLALMAVRQLFDDHRMVEPHHEEGCKICRAAKIAMNGQ